MSTTKVTRNMLDTGIVDNSNATAITIDSSENVTITGDLNVTGGQINTGNTGGDHSEFGTDGSGHAFIDASTSGGSIFLQAGGTTKISMDSNGKITSNANGTGGTKATLADFTSSGSIRSLLLKGAENTSNQVFLDVVKDINGTETTLVSIADTAVGIGTTAPSANNITRLYLTGGESVMAVRNTTATDPSHRVQIEFFDNDGTRRGYIATSNASTQYVTSSDYRLKEVTESLTNGLDRVKQLNPVKFKWTDTGNIQEGFIAHEVQEICPEAVSGEKDAVHEDGTLALQGMDYGRITPLLVKAIQEQQTIIDDLKARIEALES